MRLLWRTVRSCTTKKEPGRPTLPRHPDPVPRIAPAPEPPTRTNRGARDLDIRHRERSSSASARPNSRYLAAGLAHSGMRARARPGRGREAQDRRAGRRLALRCAGCGLIGCGAAFARTHAPEVRHPTAVPTPGRPTRRSLSATRPLAISYSIREARRAAGTPARCWLAANRGPSQFSADVNGACYGTRHPIPIPPGGEGAVRF